MINTKSHCEKALEVRFDLDWIKISQDIYDPLAPYETRHDECNGRYIVRTFYCPRVDFSYKDKRHFCYVPIKLVVDSGTILFYNYTRHKEDFRQMEEALCEMLSVFVKEN
jgi:hypothetical protein